MLVGVDFDNTIVCYDQLFHRVAVEQGLIPTEIPATKGQVRDYLRRCGREDAWTELQGHVYGARMQEATAFPGVLDFFSRCKQQGVTVYIISHKTRYPFRGERCDLHKAAYEWLESHGFYHAAQIGLSQNQVYFELTKQGKLGRITEVGCRYFIDDLPEFLLEPRFPTDVGRILFDPNNNYWMDHGFYHATSWTEIEEIIICGRSTLP